MSLERIPIEGEKSNDQETLPPLCSAAQVSKFTGVPVSTLAYWRFDGSQLPFVKLGRLVRYRREDVLHFINEHVYTNTTEAKAAR